MKFSIGNLILLIALIAISISWFLDRQRLAGYYQNREGRLQTGSRVISLAESHRLSVAQFQTTPDEFYDAITKQLMQDIFNIYRFRTELLAIGERPESAARLTLSALNCETAGEFLALADNVEFDKTLRDLSLRIEIANRESRDALVSFIEKSLAE